MSIINLNQICKIVLKKTEKTNEFKVVEKPTFKQWFLNLFRKDKAKTKYVKDTFSWSRYGECTPIEEFLKTFEEKYGDRFRYNPATEMFFERPRVVLWYSDYNHGKQVRYFNSDKEAKEYYTKLREYAKQFDIPFIDFYSEK
jgi:hypothetical protein